MAERFDPFSERARIERLEAQVLNLSPRLTELEARFAELTRTSTTQVTKLGNDLDELLSSFTELTKLITEALRKENDAEDAALSLTRSGLRKEIDALKEIVGGPNVYSESSVLSRLESLERYVYDHTHD